MEGVAMGVQMGMALGLVALGALYVAIKAGRFGFLKLSNWWQNRKAEKAIQSAEARKLGLEPENKVGLVSSAISTVQSIFSGIYNGISFLGSSVINSLSNIGSSIKGFLSSSKPTTKPVIVVETEVTNTPVETSTTTAGISSNEIAVEAIATTVSAATMPSVQLSERVPEVDSTPSDSAEDSAVPQSPEAGETSTPEKSKPATIFSRLHLRGSTGAATPPKGKGISKVLSFRNRSKDSSVEESPEVAPVGKSRKKQSSYKHEG